VPLRDLLPGGALTGGELPPPASGRPALPSGTALPQENGFDDPDPVVEEAGWGEPPPLPQSGGTVASDPPAPDPEPARPSTPEARAAWNRLFHENGIEPDEGARRKMRGVLTDCGVSVDDLVDYPTFAGVWLAARRRFGRSLGGHTAATDDEPATFQTPVPSRESGVYCVTLRPGGPDECTCKAGQHRRKCHHLPVAIGYLRMWASENDALGRGLQKDFLVLLALEEGAEEAAA
jgi:hypothetical protein